MKRFFLTACMVILSMGLLALHGLAQAQGGGSSTGSSGGSGNTGNRQPAPRQPSRPLGQPQGPMFVTGKVVMETGRPVSEPVSVELNCGLRPLQVIHTDLGGYFTFSLGAGVQSNFDFSASNESPDRKSTRLNSSHIQKSRMPSSA